MTLADFLLARIAEDEEVASDESRDPWKELRWVGPKRALAECAAKRRIVAIHDPSEEDEVNTYCTTCDLLWANEGQGQHGWPCDTMLALAQPYVDHPDFREEWKP